jgi:hypothetical protein
MKTHIAILRALLLSAVVTTASNARAQSAATAPKETELFRTVASLDSALFDSYNRCDIPKFATFFIDSAEFYHDQTGLMVGAQNIADAVKRNICGKVVRELVPGSLEVYPLKGYGAVEIGVHLFHPPNVAPGNNSAAKFIHLWQNTNGVWKITRVISFDHNSPRK